MTNATISSTLRLAAVSAAAILALTGCAAGDAAAPTDTASATSAEQQMQAPLTITDPWIKATEGEMTGVFAKIENTSSTEVKIVTASTSLGGMVELHETVVQSDGSSMMQQKQDGFTIPAGGTLELMPGHDHIMLMGLTAPIVPGDEVTVTLEFADGTTQEFTALAKEYTGGMETYAPDGSLENDPHSGHDHDGMTDMPMESNTGDDTHSGHDHGGDAPTEPVRG